MILINRTTRISSFRSSHCLHKFPSIFVVSLSTSTPQICIYDYLVNRHQFSPECAEKVSSSLSTKFLHKPQNADSVINFLKENGFTKNQIETAVRKSPGVLSANVEISIKPKIKVFQDLGFHPTDFAEIVSASPWYLNQGANKLRQSILVLKNVLGPDTDISQLLKNSWGRKLFPVDLNAKLVPNIEYLKSCGISNLQIVTYVCRHPENFLAKLETLKDYVKRVDEMGVSRGSKMFIVAVRVMCSMTRENWELKLQLFRELGLSEQNILLAFRKSPNVFALSERKIKEVTQLLLGFVDISYIASYPHLLAYSVEKRLKPRLRVIKALESKNLLTKRPALNSFCMMTDAKFVHKYVSPYSDEIRDLYSAREGSLPAKS